MLLFSQYFHINHVLCSSFSHVSNIKQFWPIKTPGRVLWTRPYNADKLVSLLNRGQRICWKDLPGTKCDIKAKILMTVQFMSHVSQIISVNSQELMHKHRYTSHIRLQIVVYMMPKAEDWLVVTWGRCPKGFINILGQKI